MAALGNFVDLFFPLAFFFLALSLAEVVVAFFVLDHEARLIRQVQRIFGGWLATFSLILTGVLVVQIWVFLTEGLRGAPDQQGANGTISFSMLVHFLFLAGWTFAFIALSFVSAYFLLVLWSTDVCVEAEGIIRKVAFGQDLIRRATIHRIVEIVYFYRITSDIRQFRTRSFFLVISSHGRFHRYALYRPTSTSAEDEFRVRAAKIATLSVVPLPGLPIGRFIGDGERFL